MTAQLTSLFYFRSYFGCWYLADNLRNNADHGLLRDANAASGTDYMIYTGKKDGTFYLVHYLGDTTANFYSVKCRMDGSGRISAESYVHNFFSYEDEDVDEYTVDDRKVDMDAGTKAFKAHRDDYKTLLFSSGYTSELKVFEKIKTDKPAATDYDDVMAKLQ